MTKIRVKYGENEIELEGSDAFIKKHLESFYSNIHFETQKTTTPATLKNDIQVTKTKKDLGKIPTPAEFYKSKKRTDGIAQILIFGKYLEEYRGKSEFTRSDINKLVGDARISKDIHGQYFTNAVQQGLLRSIKHGKYSLTISAEEVLAAMNQ